MKLNKSVKDFLALFGSSIVTKMLGFFRELLIASYFGASSNLAAYLILRTGVDFLSLLGGASALQGNIVPRFSRLFDKNKALSCNKIFTSTLKIALGVTAAGVVILLVISSLYSYWNRVESIYSLIFILSISVGVLFYNQMGYVLTQAKGDFKHYSKVEVWNYFVGTVLLYPLMLFGGILGVAISRLLGILSASLMAWKKISTKRNSQSIDNHAGLLVSDFNIYVILSTNYSLIILLYARWALGIVALDTEIVYFYYGFLILNVLTTSVGKSIASVLLQKNSISGVSASLPKILLKSLLVVVPLALVFMFFVKDFASLLLVYGNYTAADAIKTARVIQILTPLFLLHFYSLILLQPILSNDGALKIYCSKWITYIMLVSCVVYTCLVYSMPRLGFGFIYYFLYGCSALIGFCIIYFFVQTCREANFSKAE